MNSLPMTADLVARLEEYAPVVAKYGLAQPHSRASLAALLREAASALRSSGEAVGYLITWNDGTKQVSVDPCHADDGNCVPLYLHPATVTDEDVERAWRPIAEIRPKHGDPAEFAEHELVALVDVEKVAIGTKLYAPPASTSQPAASAALERV